MNTKFDVGQRVTYPIVHTADGNITGIAVSKAGVTRYAIGPKWYTEEDLKLAAEENPVTQLAESEPVKLYCVKSFVDILSAGKIYEPDESGHITYDDGRKSSHPVSDWEFDFIRIGNLVPLVRRPAKIGEWVYVLDRGTSRYEEKRIYKVFDTGSNSCVWFADDCKGNIREENYLVLDGYTGGPT